MFCNRHPKKVTPGIARWESCQATLPHRRPIRKGFSLVEIMIVIVIIGLLAGLVTVNVRSYLAKAKQMVESLGVTVIGAVLNNINIMRDDYYYYYNSYYSDYYHSHQSEMPAEDTV